MRPSRPPCMPPTGSASGDSVAGRPLAARAGHGLLRGWADAARGRGGPGVPGRADRAPVRGIARRFGYGTLVAIGVLLMTGAAMASHFHRWDDGTLQVKLVLVAVVAGLVGWHMRKA